MRILHAAAILAAIVALRMPNRVSAEIAGRQHASQFAEKPAVVRDGDNFTVRFAVNGYCDVTVAVEDGDGRIVRHLASGVLGSNAPEPFGKDSLTQALVWDGKDDRGEYLRNLDTASIRISLGLKAQFERTLFWSPHKRAGDPKGVQGQPTLAVAAKEGVYVYEGAGPDHVRLFDHEGHYVRTIYPFAARDLGSLPGLKWHTFDEDGLRLPLRWGLAQQTLLTSGDLGFAKNWPTGGGGSAATAMLRYGDELLMINQRINRLGVGAGRPWLREGPITGIPLTVKDAEGRREFTRAFHVSPRSAALSPDGKWLYLAGFNYNAYFRSHALHGVARVAVDGDGGPETFAGVMKTAGAFGSGDDRFNMPGSIACDNAGRVYVADWGNSRIQVFSPDARLLKSIPVDRPAQIRIHPATGELYVFSWTVAAGTLPTKECFVKPTLRRLGSFDNPRQIAAFALDVATGGGGMPPNTRVADAEVDFHTDPPTIWLSRNQPISWSGDHPPEKMGALLLVEEDGKLVVKRDFLADARRQVARLYGPRHSRQRLYVNPATGWLYVGEHAHPAGIHTKSITELVAINPDNGRVRLVPLPFDAEDIAFDMAGHAHLRTLGTVARYDSTDWREVPFDYGESRPKHGYHPFKLAPVTSITTAVGDFNASSQMGGLAVSPKGHIAMTVHNPARVADRNAEKNIHADSGGRAYAPRMFPGRARGWEIHVWDKHGKLLYEDAVPGIASCSGLAIDRDDSLYILSAACHIHDGKRHFNDTTCTLIKVRPGKATVLSTRSELPLSPEETPKRPADLEKGDLGRAWVVGAEWIRGGVGMDAKMLSSASRDCHCTATSRLDMDYFARVFVPEVDRCSVLVLDSNGNAVMRIGRYGNVDDGRPLVPDGGPVETRSIGGDEVALFWANHVATHSDRRLFIADPGNARILSVKLDYHVTERLGLKP